MFKWVAIVISVLVFAFCAFCYVSRVSERCYGLIEGRMTLKSAAMDIAGHDHFTYSNYGSSYGVWLSSNTVSIGGIQYRCFLVTTNHWFLDEGALAMTTNHEVIWLDSKRPPKLIDANYRPPMFPPRF
jgi:hypothetical protein